MVLFEIAVEERVVGLDDLLDHRLARRLGGVLHIGRDLSDLGGDGLVAVPVERIHLNEVDDALELVLAPDRELDDDGIRAEPVDDHVDAALEVSAHTVLLVDEADARDLVLVGLAPDRLGLRLDAGDAIEHDDRAVKHAERALHLDGEVDMTRRVDDVDAVVVPEARRRGRGDRDAALLLLWHPVHRRGAVVYLADLVDLLGEKEDPLGHGGLARVDVRDDPDVPVSLQGILAPGGLTLDGLRFDHGRYHL